VSNRPRVTFLADFPHWAFDSVARSLTERLADRFEINTAYTCRKPRLDPARTDLLYVFFWGETHHQQFGFPRERVIKEVASWRWALEPRWGQLSLDRFVQEHLSDCAWVTTPSQKLYEALHGTRERVFHCPNGIETGLFHPRRRRRGPLRIGWVGNPKDACKGLHDILTPACRNFSLEATDGRWTRAQVARLYDRIDVIAIASEAESQPLPLLEGMASGLFPVTTNVGVVPELVRNGVNGLVAERSVEAFREAFQWCAENLDEVRRAGAFNAELVASERSWDQHAERFAQVFDAALGRAAAPPATPAQAAPSRSRRALTRGQLPRRIAFVTAEFVTEYPTGGGLGNYLSRITQALLEAGHEPEIFTLSPENEGTIDWRGVPVHRVRRTDANRAVRTWIRGAWRLGVHGFEPPWIPLLDAQKLARTLEKRDAEHPFDLVQSADFRASGYCVKSLPDRPHVVRCSGDGLLWAYANGDVSLRRRWEARLERTCVQRADVAYAPSRFVAERLARRYDIDVQVVRPPARLETKPEPELSYELPERYLIHFGQLSAAKGTPVIARALPHVWERAPDFTMVWAGPDRGSALPEWRESWGEHQSQVVWLGELTKPEVYAVLQRAEAAVLPSAVDNLPNTVIESLLLGIPVIGTVGSSIDELVEPGETGELVPVGDGEALARAMLRVWRGRASATLGFHWDSPLAHQMQPANAVGNLLRLAGLEGEA
jgi:glycosyltransferase involved in cell wall biosynthesis